MSRKTEVKLKYYKDINMNEVKMNWAGTEQYKKARAVLVAQNLDVKNVYLMEKVLTAMGYDTFMGNLTPWIKAHDVEIDLSGITKEVA